MTDDLISRAAALAVAERAELDFADPAWTLEQLRALPAVDVSGPPIGSQQAPLPSSDAQQAAAVEAEPKCALCEDSPKAPNITCAVCAAHPSDTESLRGEVARRAAEVEDRIKRYEAFEVELWDRNAAIQARAEKAEAERDAALARVAGLQEALIWCSGSDDFQEGGKARVGWLKLCAPLIAPEALSALTPPPTAEPESLAKQLCFVDCEKGRHLDYDAGCCSICKSPKECQGWVPYLSEAKAVHTALRARKGGA